MMSSELNFTEEEILRLYSQFNAIDESQHGYILLSKVLKIKPELAHNPLTRRVLEVFDKDQNGRVSFVEFITGLSRIAAQNETEKLKFLFQVYDEDNDGLISADDLFAVVKLMSGDNLTEYQLWQLVHRTIRDLDTTGDGLITFDEFTRGLKNNVNLSNQLNLEW